jgi:hypothetical protein
MVKRLCIASVAGFIAMTAVVPGAAADPKAATFTNTCDNGKVVELAFNGNGDFTPSHDLGGTGVYVVQSLESTQVRTPLEGPASTQYFFASKPNMHGNLVTCTFDVVRTSPEGTLHAFGTLDAFVTPMS